MSIKMSPKHGLNVCIPICFWCGSEKNEIVMLGKIDKEDSPAPSRPILNYDPCDKCKEAIGDGVHIIGVQNTPIVKSMMPITKKPEKLYPTGSFIVTSKEWARAMLEANGNGNIVDEVIEKQILLMYEDVIQKVIADANKAGVPDYEVNTDFIGKDNRPAVEEEKENEDN